MPSEPLGTIHATSHHPRRAPTAAELVRNRVFKDDNKTPAHWSVVRDAGGSAAIALDWRYPVAATALTTSLRLERELRT